MKKKPRNHFLQPKKVGKNFICHEIETCTYFDQ